MRILCLDGNKSFEMNEVPTEVDDLRFCVLDNSDPKDPDYFYVPLLYLESFNSPALVLKLGEDIVRMPADWQILIGSEEGGNLEVIPLTDVNDRGFTSFVYNPIDGFSPDFVKIEVVDIYPDVRWYFPKLRPGQLLAVPLRENSVGSKCAFFVRDIARQCEVVDYGKAW